MWMRWQLISVELSQHEGRRL